MAELTIDVALHPEQRRAVTRGRLVLRNLTAQPIPEIHVRTQDDTELTGATIAGAQITSDDATYKYRIFRLDKPMQPGDERVMEFETRYQLRGFRNKPTFTRIAEKDYRDYMRPYLREERASYLAGRQTAWQGEPPLVRVNGEDHVTYRKGAHVMYLLQVRLGEDRVNRALRTLIARYRFKGAPYARSLELVAALRAEARTAEEQQLITDLLERVTLYDLKVTAPTAVRRADGRWDVSVPVDARKLYADGRGGETEGSLDEHIEIGLFAAEPGPGLVQAKNMIVMERRPIRSGAQVVRFVTDRKPTHAYIDPYNYYMDRNLVDNVQAIPDPE